MLLFYGSGEGKSVMGDLPEQICPSCGNRAARTAVCVWDYVHLWYLFNFITKRRYRTVCKGCGAVAEYDRADARAAGLSDRIPFMKRKGWMVGVGLIALIAFISVRVDAENRQRLQDMVSAPATGDIYKANLAKIPGSGYKPGKDMFGTLMLLESGGGDRFLVATSNTAWDKKKGLTRNMDDLEYSVSRLDNGEPLTLSREELAAYVESDVIYDGERDAEGGARGEAPASDREPGEKGEMGDAESVTWLPPGSGEGSDA